MAIAEVSETYERKCSLLVNWQRTYVRTFTVVTDDPWTGAVAVSHAVDPNGGAKIPSLGNSYNNLHGEFDTGSFAQQIDADCTADDGLQWRVVVSYGPYDPNENPQNPLDHPLKINWGFAEFRKVVDVDNDELPITNSAGELFKPAPEADDSRPVLTIQRNEQTFDPAIAALYKDALNSDSFFGRDPLTWKFMKIEADLQWNPDIGWYYMVTYELQYNPDTWILKIDDNGLRELGDDGDLSPVILKDAGGNPIWPGNPVTDPVLLDGDGGVLPPGEEPVVLEFHVQKELRFAELNLDPAGAPGQPNG